MPDVRHELLSVVEDGNRAAFESVVVGTFTGSLPTPTGSMPGTGARISFRHAQFIAVDGEGRITEDHDYADMAEIMAKFAAPATVG